MDTIAEKENRPGRNPKKPFPRKTVIIAVCAAAALIVIFGVYAFASVPKDAVVHGVYVDQIDMGGKTLEEAIQAITQAQPYQNKALSITSGGKSFTINPADIDLVVDSEKTAKHAFEICKTGNAFKNAGNALKLKFSQIQIHLVPALNTEKLDALLLEFGKQVNGELKQHEIQINADSATIIPGTSGQSQSVEKARNEIIESISNSKFDNINVSFDTEHPNSFNADELCDAVNRPAENAQYAVDGKHVEVKPHVMGVTLSKEEAKRYADKIQEGGSPVTVKVEKIMPDVTTDMLKEKLFNATLSSFSTKYNAKAANRSANVALAANKMNGTILGPGDVFSYNDVVGKRTVANGFKNAPVYENGKSVDGIGGGVCQVSTTLYSAVLYADLEVVSRINHSLTVSYVPLGQDATVVDGAIDFKFKNDTEYPVKVVASASGGTLTISLVGTKRPVDREVKLFHETVATVKPTEKEINDPNLPAGTRKVTSTGKSGYTVVSTKKVYENGVEVSSKSLGKSVYKMVPTEVSVGTSAAPTAAEPVPTQTPAAAPTPTTVPTPKPETHTTDDTQ